MTFTTKSRWHVLATAIAALLLITLDNSILYTALPTLERELGASPGESLWIINAYPLVMAGLLLGAGTLGDRVGHRTMLLAGLSIFGVASLVAAFAPTAVALIAARAFLAVGAAAMMPATLAVIRTSFQDERERTFAIAIWGSMSLVGFGLGPILSGLLLHWFWWGSVFLINVPVVIVAVIGVILYAPKPRPDVSKPWDFQSSAMSLMTMGGLVLAIKEAVNPAASWQMPAVALAISVVFGFLFVRRQGRLEHPSLDFNLFRNPALSAGIIAAAAGLFGFAGLQLITSQRFQLVAGFTPTEAGLLVSVVILGAIPMSLIGGAFLHRLGLRNLISGGLGLAAVAAVGVAVGLNHGVLWVAIGILAMGIGLGASMSVASTGIIGNAPVEQAGMAASMEEVSFEFGALLAVALLGSLLAALYSLGLVLPAGAPEAARSSLSDALTIAEAGGPQSEALWTAAATAFDRSYVVVLYVVAAVLGLGAVVTGVLLRRYGPGSQSTLYPH